MRNLLRQPLTWMVIAECIVMAVLMLIVWNVVATAAARHPAAAPVQAVEAPPEASTSVPPELADASKPAAPAPLPGLKLDSGFWRFRLGQLNRDQVILEQLEWRIVHTSIDTVERYLETVVLPSISRAERGGGGSRG